MQEKAQSFPRLSPIFAVVMALCAAGAAPAQEPRSPAAAPSETGAIPPDAGITEIEPRVSSHGVKFVPVPGTHVLFGSTEVTVGEYAKFLESTGYQPPNKPHFEQGQDHPVVGVNREDADAFCRWLTAIEREQGLIGSNHRYRLPDRKEWNLAVRLDEPMAGRNAIEQEMRSKTFYPWGEEWPPVESAGNFASKQLKGYEDPFVFTAPVKSFSPNEYGIYDLAGNAWEWCESDAVSGTPRWVLRGGSWIYFVPETLLASYEYSVSEGLRASSFGFRCVFEDPDLAPKVTREIMAAEAREQEKARERFVTEREKDGAMTAEAAEAQRAKFTDRGESPEGAGKTDLQGARSRMLDRLGEASGGGPGDAAARVKVRPEGYVARMGEIFENGLGMQFVPLQGAKVLIGKTEVRVRDYALFLSENPGVAKPDLTFKQGDNHPAVKVSWDHAVAFCDWLTKRERAGGWIAENQAYRLPYDLEWSRAAGISDETGAAPADRSAVKVDFFPWGTDWPPPKGTANIDAIKIRDYEDPSVYTGDVAKAPANAAGVCDLGGNVSEWCQDDWSGGSSEKTVRGGSWMTTEREELVSSYRRKLKPGAVLINVGFRCVLAEE